MKNLRRYLLIFLLLFAFICPGYVAAEGYMEVHFLDVGQGQATLFRQGDDVILIDGGGQGRSSFVVAYLKERGISKVDLMVATHFDEDHIAGLIGVMNVFPVSKILMGTHPIDTRVSNSFVQHARNYETYSPVIGDVFYVGDMTLEIKGPRYYGNDDHNDDSIISLVRYGDTSFLVGGDTNADTEQQLLYQDIQADVMLANHHGSKGSTSRTWLEAVDPQHIVISCGKDNPYGHPGETVMQRISQTDASLYRTDESGTIVFTGDGQSVSLSAGIPFGFYSAVEAEVQGSVDSSSGVAAEEVQLVDYVLNINTKKFHHTGCRSVKQMKESNKLELSSTRDEVIAQGYSPCGNCNP